MTRPLCVEDRITENEGHYTSTLLENVNALHALPMSKTALLEDNYFTVNELRACLDNRMLSSDNKPPSTSP